MQTTSNKVEIMQLSKTITNLFNNKITTALFKFSNSEIHESNYV
jgi:hypothetical protein